MECGLESRRWSVEKVRDVTRRCTRSGQQLQVASVLAANPSFRNRSIPLPDILTQRARAHIFEMGQALAKTVRKDCVYSFSASDHCILSCVKIVFSSRILCLTNKAQVIPSAIDIKLSPT